MTRIRWIPTVVAATLVAALPAAADSANRIVARVNDRIATLYDFEVRLEDSLRRADDLPDDVSRRQEYLTELAREVMKELFEELLVLSRADQLGITVTASEVTDAINRMRQANGLENDQEFRQALAQSGLEPEQLRSQFEQQMRFQRVVGREVYSGVQMEEEDLRRYYRDHLEEFRQPEQVKLREIVVLDDTGSDPAAGALAARLAEDLAGGEPLEDAIAKAAPGRVSEVIELGWVESGDLAPALESAVWTLESGAWSEPTRARGGVHLAQVIERRESVIPTFKEVEAEIRAREERARLNERLKSYLAELEQKAYLYLDPPPEAAGFRTASGETPLNVEFPVVAPSDEAGAGKARGKDAAAPAQGDQPAVEGAAEAAGAEAAEVEDADSEVGDPAGVPLEPVEDPAATEEREIEEELRQVPEEELDLKPVPEDAEGPDGLPPTPPR